MIYDLIIIGGGPAGVSAGVYAARKKLKTLLLTYDFGGQSTVSDGIENWIGTIKISGQDLAKSLENHLRAYAENIVEIKTGEWVKEIKFSPRSHLGERFVVITDKNQYQSKTVLVATGSHRRKLEVPGAKEFDNKGLTYCASCDGPIFAGQDVVVVGGGNAALETSAQLLAYCKSVTLLNRSDTLKGDPVTAEKLLGKENFKIIKNAETLEIHGDKFVTGLTYSDKENQKHKLEVTGIFVEIGLLPATDFVKELIQLNQIGQITVDPRNQRSQIDGLWAAGDCADGIYHQNNIASGDAVKALEDIYLWLTKHS